MGRLETLIAVVGIGVGGLVLAITALAAPQEQPPSVPVLEVAPPPAAEVTEIVVPAPVASCRG